jgi:hypothetical protein
MEVNQESSRQKSGPKRGRPNEIKVSLGLRIYYSDQEKIKAKYGSMQKFFDKKLAEELESGEVNPQD